jgi:high-affinity iron transporter
MALFAATAMPPAPADFALAGDAERGRTVFVESCVLCHGPSGDGQSRMAATMQPKPANLIDPALAAKRSDWEVYLLVRDGGEVYGRSAKMFPWKPMLTDQEIRDVTAYVRTLTP